MKATTNNSNNNNINTTIKEEKKMAKMYRNKKDGTVCEFVEQNDKAKTVTLKKDDGTFMAKSISTFKRWWAAVDDQNMGQEKPEADTADDAVETNDAPEAETNAAESVENTESDPQNDDADANAEPKKETKKKAKEPKPKKEKKESKTIDETIRIHLRDEIMEKLAKIDGVKASWSDKYPLWINVIVGEKNGFGIGLSSTHIRVRTLKELVQKGVEFREVKGAFTATVTYQYGEDDKIVEAVKYAADNFKNDPILQKKKREKKAAEPKAEKPKAAKKDNKKANKKEGK